MQQSRVHVRLDLLAASGVNSRESSGSSSCCVGLMSPEAWLHAHGPCESAGWGHVPASELAGVLACCSLGCRMVQRLRSRSYWQRRVDKCRCCAASTRTHAPGI